MNTFCQRLRMDYLDYPQLVHLETIALCNARCGFCPYESMERKGVKMPDELIEKIISDLADVPPNVRFQINPYKVSEPFLEPRLFDILQLIIDRIPNAQIGFITNGSPLTEKKIQQLTALDAKRFGSFKVSLNTMDATEYENVMHIELDKTLRRLDVLHDYVARGEFKLKVHITRVSMDLASDQEFIVACKQRYPHFDVFINRRNDWIGTVENGNALLQVPDAACRRWFDLSITATGKVAMCCMDGEAQYPKGDAAQQHVLEIYNQPHLQMLRLLLPSRLASDSPCNTCTYLN
jgi:hypothetical protein